MKPDEVIVDVPAFFVSGERYSRKGLLAGIPPGIRVSHLNNFATVLDLMGVPNSLRVRPYDKSIFSLTAGDNRVRTYMSGSLHGSGDYVVKADPDTAGSGLGRFETCPQRTRGSMMKIQRFAPHEQPWSSFSAS